MHLTGRHNLKLAVQLILAWLFLNLLINMDYPAPSFPSPELLKPSLEVWALLLALSILSVFKAADSVWIYVPMILAVVFLRLFRLGDTLMPAYFSRPFNLYIDSGYVPDLIHLLYHSQSLPRLMFYVLAAAMLLSALLWGIHKSLRLALRAFSAQRLRRLFWGLTALQAAWVGLYLYGIAPFGANFPAATCSPRLMEEAIFILKIGEIKREGLAAVQMAGSRIQPFTAPLAGLGKSDVYLIFIESYGETLFADTAHAREFAPTIRAFETALTRSGFTACSRFLQSPTFGGASWLGFGTLESGQWLPDQLRYNFLLNSRVAPLAEYFNRAGYRTISVMPGTTMPWPEGKYFEYTRTYYAKDLEYRGPPFAWSPMPDQYTLHFIYTREIAQRREPLFIRYMLTSSHAPFNTQPPYVQNWDEIGHGEIYQRIRPVTFSSDWPDLKEGGRAYETAICYDFTVLQDYLCSFVKDGALIIILGDHQPVVQITGPGASRLVPIHVISRNPALIDPFIRMGYAPGMIPSHAPSVKGMDDFLADFLTAFSTP
ncbi:MAG: hypothetical protein HY881_04550 [Deltaproteobacteria bacterium]|nr:hypothetical protein [Deltaproteobacteria bacterium]